MTRWPAAHLAILLGCLLLAQAGCGFAHLPQVRISGTVYGITGADASAAAPISATVTCGGVRATTSAQGTYSMTVGVAGSYRCTASAPPRFQDQVAAVEGVPPFADFTLNFGPMHEGLCAEDGATTRITCPALHPQPGALTGTITSADSHRPATGTTVRCWAPAGPIDPATGNPAIFTVKTGKDGAYTLRELPADQYVCVAGADPVTHTSTVAPRASTTLSFTICGAHCPPVTYHSGPVLHTLTAYLIFWLPPSYAYDSLGSPSIYEALMARYFTDVSGTPFAGILTQYWDYQGAVRSTVRVGGTYVDTHRYPHAATRADPITDDDIATEVKAAIQANKWTADLEHAFFVFTGYGAEVCGHQPELACSFPVGKSTFCGYHSYIPDARAVYALIPDGLHCMDAMSANPTAGPNHDRVADFAIAYLSHEHFELVSDPLTSAWYTGDGGAGEIADRCVREFGPMQPDGGTITLHEHGYYLQQEWSNLANACVYG